MKEKKTWIILFIIPLIIALGLGGYVAYESFKPVEEKECPPCNTIPTKEDSKEETKKGQVTLLHPYGYAVVYDKEVYVNISASTGEIDNLYGDGTYQALVTTRNTYQEYSFDALTVVDQNNATFKGMKLNINNVKAVYSYLEGQDVSTNSGLLILKEDGSLSIVSLYSLITGKKDSNKTILQNVTAITSKENGGYETFAVTKDGKETNLKTYIPTNYKEW